MKNYIIIIVIVMCSFFLKGGSVYALSGDEPEGRGESAVIDALKVKDMDVRDVLKLIALKSGLNIIAGQHVQGKATIYLKDVDARDALKIILDINSLVYVEEQNIIKVMTAQEFEVIYGYSFTKKVCTKIIPLLYADSGGIKQILEQMKGNQGKIIYDDKTKVFILIDSSDILQSMELVIKKMDVPVEKGTFKLKYARAEKMAEKIKPILTSDVGQVEFDSILNEVIVTDTVLKIKEFEKLIEQFDANERKILIEAKVFQITLNDEHPDGVDWEAIVSDYQDVEFSGFKYENEKNAGGCNKLSLGTITEEDSVVLLEALETVGVVEAVQDVEMREIKNAGFEIAIEFTDILLNYNENEDGEKLYKNEAEEIRLCLIPEFYKQDEFVIQVKPYIFSTKMLFERDCREKGLASSGFSGKESFCYPMNPSGSETVVAKVQEGSMIVLGGLFKEEVFESTRKVPLLGELPFFGVAFRRHGETVLKAEIVVFLTPKISVNQK